MKRILVTGMKDPLGGVEHVAMGYIRQLHTLGFQVDVAVFQNTFSLSEQVESLGGKVWFLPSRKEQMAVYRQAVSTIFSKTTYDAVWCHFSGLTNIDILKAAKKFGVPIRIAHAHTSDFAWGTPLMRYVVPVLHKQNQRIIHRFATHFFACSQKAASFMFGEVLSARTTMISNAIDVEKFRFDPTKRQTVRQQYGLTDRFVILHVGRMCVAKNQMFLLDVFKYVHHLREEAVLLFVGDGELRKEIETHAMALGVSVAVCFVGETDSAAAFMQAADVFFLPSLTEGFPVTLVEAQAAGLPCVVSKQAVSQEADILQRMRFVSLDAPVQQWADAILSVGDERVADAAEQVIAGGFDQKTAVKRVQAILTAKRVGLVTFPRAYNYGTALQAVALQSALEMRGADPYFADHICEKIEAADRLLDIKRILDWKYTVAHLLNLPTARKRAAKFRQFSSAFMRFGPENPRYADTMIAGSDQIWNTTLTGNDRYYFLDFPKQNIKKAAYAASFGVSELDKEQMASLRGVLSDFDFLSVREQQGAAIVREILDVDVPIVCDPTLLLTKKEWERYMVPSETTGGYIFVYTVFNSEEIWGFAQTLSERTGLPIKTVSYSTLHKHSAIYDYTAGPAEWLRYMADADYVVTNSFHGVVFSLNFEKQFFYQLPPVSSGVASRLSHVAKRYDLIAREIGNADVKTLLSFETIREKLDNDRSLSQKALDEILM